MVEAFRSIPAKLVIVCSRTNLEELQETNLPPNVDVMCDVSIAAFDDYIRGAKAGIFLCATIPAQPDRVSPSP